MHLDCKFSIMWSFIYIVFVTLYNNGESLGLPEYMKPCLRNNPQLNECTLKSGKESIKKFVLGDLSRNLQPLDPIYVPEIVVYIPDHNGLKIVFKDNYFKGLSELQLQRLDFNLNKRIIISDAVFNSDIKNTYEISGKLLLLPIFSRGNSSIKLINTKLNLRMWYEHIMKDDGKVYWNITKHTIKYEMERAYFRLDNLLGDKNIGDQVNNMLNQMWHGIVAEVGPTISESLSSPVITNLMILLNQVSYGELFPE